MMLPLSFGLVFALNILGAHSRAQVRGFGDSGTDSVRTDAPIGNCQCTPFYKCHDDETSSILNNFVQDRTTINLPIISLKQERGPNDCLDLLDVCCYNLVKPSASPIPSQPKPPVAPSTIPSAAQAQVEVVQQAAVLESLPSSCTDNRPQVSPEASCGVRNTCGIDFAVSGFKEGQAQYGEFPWMAAVLTSNIGGHGEAQGAKNLYVGGGSLIHPQVVLTAAHKVQEHKNKTITVRLGEWNFASTSETTAHQDITVRDVIIHDRYDPQRKTYDIALLVLEQPATLGETVQTICLATKADEHYNVQQDCMVSGWGKDVFGETGRYQRILKSLSVNLVERSQCQSALQSSSLGSDLQQHFGSDFKIHHGALCAGDQGRDLCTGDGGSPLVCRHPTWPGQYVQMGVALWGIGCGQQGLPGVYWAIPPMTEWIDHKIGNLKK